MSKRKVREMIQGMTFREKADYLWTYYKWVLPVAAFAVIVVSMVVTGIMNKQIEVLYGGALVNVTASEDGAEYLTDGWLAELGGKDKEKVELFSTSFQDIAVASDANAASVTQVVAMVAARELDYVILEDTGLELYEKHHIFASLEDIFPQEVLEQQADAIVYYEDEEGTYPIAIEITDCAFAQECLEGSGKRYIAFPGNTGRTARNTEFLEYLLNWGKSQ